MGALRLMLAIANLLFAPVSLWIAALDRGRTAVPFALAGLGAVAALYALLARAHPRLRALLLAPSAITWLGVVVVGLMFTFLGPMDGAPPFFWPALVPTTLALALAGATIAEVAAAARSRAP